MTTAAATKLIWVSGVSSGSLHMHRMSDPPHSLILSSAQSGLSAVLQPEGRVMETLRNGHIADPPVSS